MKFRNAGIASLVLFCASCSDESEKMEADVVNSIPLLAFVAIALPNDLSYKRLNVSEVIDKVFHIQNVNAHHGCLKG